MLPRTTLPAAYLAAFSEQPGYLDFASYGPPSQQVLDTVAGLMALATEGPVGASAELHREDQRARATFSRLSGFAADRTVLVPATSYGLFQLAFGVGGETLVGAGEFPANTYPWLRAARAGAGKATLVGGAGTHMAPSLVAQSLSPGTTAVAVSAVDFRTGYRADLAGIREAIGPDRLLLVDAIQGFGVADIDWTVADAIVVGSQKWVRGGWGAGAMAFSEAGLERIRPVLGGWTGVQDATVYDAVEHPARPDAQKFAMTNLSPFATGGFATALELIEEAGVAAISAAVEASAGHLVGQLENAGVDVLSPTDPAERAGIVVAGFPEGNAGEVRMALNLAGFSATLHGRDRIRMAVHATTDRESLDHAALILAGFA